MRCGDHVLHRPSGETWVVAYVDGNDLAPCGWPDSIARTSDCELVKGCTDDEHVKWLREIAKAQAGRRSRMAQTMLDQMFSQSVTQ